MDNNKSYTKNYFSELYDINVNDKTETKGDKVKLTYLSWAWAWAELKKRHPMSYYTVYENALGWNYHTDGKTAWVKTGVTVVLDDGTPLEHIEYLPIMNNANMSIPVEKITSFDTNRAIMRSLTKSVARHGVGLYVYAGEDLPECETDAAPAKAKKETPAEKPTEAQIKKLELLGVVDKQGKANLQGIANWCHKTLAELTAADVEKAIAEKIKEKAAEKAGADNE